MSQYLIYIISALFALLPAILWLVIWYRKDNKEPEPKRLIFRCFLFGILGIMPFLGLRYVLQFSPNLISLWAIFETKTLFLSTIILALILALMEESVKHFAVLRLGKALKIEFNQVVDGIIYSVSAALGFAFAENVYYFANAFFVTGISSDFWMIFIFRSFGTMLAHSIFSGIFGFFWGYAFLSMKITPYHNVSVLRFFEKIFNTLRFHIIFHHVLKGKESAHGHEKRELVAEALLFATIVHAIFNLLIKTEFMGKSLTFLIVPILMFGFLFLSKTFLEKRNVKIWDVV